MHYKNPKNRNEILLHPHVDNWVGKDNPIRLVDLIVDKVVLSNPDKFLWKGQTKVGCKSYAPATMLKLLLYGYLNKLPGSRCLERETYRNIELMWLLGELHPDHWTICEYRRENKEQIRFVTIEFRNFLKSENYIGCKRVAFDGSKFKAYAAREILSIKNIEKRLDDLDKTLDEYFDEFQKNDAIEELKDEIESLDSKKEINTALINKIVDLQKEIETLKLQKIQLEKTGKNYLAPNDSDANLMKSRDGKIPAYNGQIGVDAKNKMIVLGEISTSPTDIHLLKENTDNLKEQLDIEPDEIDADKGYGNLADIQNIEESSNTKCFIPLQENKSKKKDKENKIEFKYDPENDQYVCPEGKSLKLKQKNLKHRQQTCNVYHCKDCLGCPIREKCTESKKGRFIKRNINQQWVDKYKERMLKPKSKEKIKERKELVEHPFGSIKWMMGKLCFLLTSKEKVQIEFDLYTTVYNFKRLINIDNMELLLQKAENYAWKSA